MQSGRVRNDESAATNAEEVERARKRQRQAEDALAESAAKAEQDSPVPTPDEVGFVPGCLGFDGANVESYPMPDEIKGLDISQFGMFVNAINRDCLQLNCVIRDPIKGSGQKSLTMHVVKFKTAPNVIPFAVAELAEKNPAKHSNYHSLVVHRTVVSFEPALKQATIDAEAGKEFTKYQHPCVVMLNRRHLWNFCERLVWMFNHAVREDLGAKKALDGWEPMKLTHLTPFVEGDGNKGYGVKTKYQDQVDEDYFKGSACTFGSVKIVLKLAPPIGYMHCLSGWVPG